MYGPIGDVLVDGVAVSKADLRAYFNENTRVILPEVQYVVDDDLTGINLIEILGGSRYAYDASDTTSAHDGVNVLVDDAGRRYIAEVDEAPIAAPSVRIVTAAGDVTVLAADDIIFVNKSVGAATNVNLGLAADRNGKPITIKDMKKDADSNNISFTTSGGELIDGIAASNWSIISPGGALKLQPVSGGWQTVP